MSDRVFLIMGERTAAFVKGAIQARVDLLSAVLAECPPLDGDEMAAEKIMLTCALAKLENPA
jgi:hypothetical protein